MAGPTLVAVYGNPTPSATRGTVAGSGGTTYLVTASWAAGDVLITSYCGENGTSLTGGVPTATGLTFSRLTGMPLNGSGANGCFLDAYQATAGAAGTSVTVTFTLTGGNAGENADVLVYRFSGVTGVGTPSTTANNSASTDTVGTVSLTTTADHSAVVYQDGDWAAVSQTTPTFSTATAGTYTVERFLNVGTAYSSYGGVYTDSGVAGAKTIGLTSGTAMRNSRWAVEVKGTPKLERLPFNPVAQRRSSNW